MSERTADELRPDAAPAREPYQRPLLRPLGVLRSRLQGSGSPEPPGPPDWKATGSQGT